MSSGSSCPHCGSQMTDIHDWEVDDDEVLTHTYCEDCGTTWTGVWRWGFDIGIERGEEDDNEAADRDSRAADMNATLRDIGGTRL